MYLASGGEDLGNEAVPRICYTFAAIRMGYRTLGTLRYLSTYLRVVSSPQASPPTRQMSHTARQP